MNYEYACTNGFYIIGQPGSLIEAQTVKNQNYDAAKRIGDKARFELRLVRRRSSNRLNKRPGKWEAFEPATGVG